MNNIWLSIPNRLTVIKIHKDLYLTRYKQDVGGTIGIIHNNTNLDYTSM